MKIMRFLAILTAAGCALSACGSSGGEGDGSGGNVGSGGSASGGVTGSGGHGSGGSGSGGSAMTGSGGHASGGAVGNGSGGSGSGGNGSGGNASGGATGSGGATASGGNSGSGGSMGSGGGAAGHASTGGAGGRGMAGSGGAGGGSTASGGSGVGGSSGGAPGGGGYNPCPSSGLCKILPLGDSITYGLITVAADKSSTDSSINGKDSHGGYRVKLFADAVSAGQMITFTGALMNGPDMVMGMPFPKSNSGYSGYTIDNSTGNGINTTAVLDPAFQTLPDIILLHIGTNDVYSQKGMQSGMADRLSALLDELAKRAPKALVVVATIIPLGGGTGSATNSMTITTYNGKIPDVVAKQVAAGHHVVMVDMFTGFMASKYLSGDGVHPNQMGYDYMGDTFYGAISALLPK